ncbi:MULTISPECIES: hypothetical protein [unclassified Mycoplasma]|uniref:hypothetical protein n=1 Tax=unclassified Mycoplasma TaxID=2683645 RepID=UPI001C10F137|nr:MULTISPECIES: hypothetical protein [unclassified Mycoplasma]MBU4693195.1 hypothetical protein [Mycoplasma sp. CSL7491-lung]MCU4706549.1 hypothetical protein [Mycoplasma sp. CSL7503-lung]
MTVYKNKQTELAINVANNFSLPNDDQNVHINTPVWKIQNETKLIFPVFLVLMMLINCGKLKIITNTAAIHDNTSIV